MKFSEAWLREWVNSNLSREELAQILTKGGLEVENILPVSQLTDLHLDTPSAKEDYQIDLNITPNRGDCLSILGISRELSALTAADDGRFPKHPFKHFVNIPPIIDEIFKVATHATEACPRYVGRVVKNIRVDASTPPWMTARLALSGIRSIHPVVDIMNYVMLELGQPMHAFDLNKLSGEVQIRFSSQGENIQLLDETKITLDDKTLLIADKLKPLAIAGVMGGLDSGVTNATSHIFLESAYFSPAVIAAQRQKYQLNSDSAYRFERGVDWNLQRSAIERATQLILEIVGGEPGPVIEVVNNNQLPNTKPIQLNVSSIESLLGFSIPQAKIEKYLVSLGFNCSFNKEMYTVHVPSFRFDIQLPEDLIEEIVRLHGYDHIPTHTFYGELKANLSNLKGPETVAHHLRQHLYTRGYHEILTYSFISSHIQKLLDPLQQPRLLLNPINSEMSVMRTNLWAGLLLAAQYNASRQQERLRLFEIGTCFIDSIAQVNHIAKLAGLIRGQRYGLQWGEKARNVDFYDLKGDIDYIFNNLKLGNEIRYEETNHPVLHPGQSAVIYYHDQAIGLLGAVHPNILQALDLNGPIFIFEINLNHLPSQAISKFRECSKFPEIRRDIAILLKETIPAKQIQDTIKQSAGDWLADSYIFDLYQGKGVPVGCKSVAIALVWQHPTRTLVDEEVSSLMNHIIQTLKDQLGAELRR